MAYASGRFRYGSDETTSNYTTALTTGLNAVFREQPTASTSSLTLSMTYGDALPTITGTGTVNGDAASYSITGRVNSTSGNIKASGTPYAITESLTGLGYLANSSSSASTGTLTVAAKALTMSGLSVAASKVYNGLGYSIGATYGYTISGFAPGDTAWNAVSGTPGYWSGSPAQGAVNAGSYAITPTAGSLSLKTSNYTLAYADGTLTVSKAPLTVRINNDARFLTEQDNILTTAPTVTSTSYAGASYSGFVANQTTAVLGGALNITRVGGDTAAGVYTGVLTGSGLTSNNYSFSYVPGNYTIVPADQLLVKLTNIQSNYSNAPA